MWLIIIKKGFLLILIDTSFFPLAQCSWFGAVQLNSCTICEWAAAVSFFLLWRLKISSRWRRNCRMCTSSINAWTPRVWSSLLVLCCHDLMMVWSLLQMRNCYRGTCCLWPGALKFNAEVQLLQIHIKFVPAAIGQVPIVRPCEEELKKHTPSHAENSHLFPFVAS